MDLECYKEGYRPPSAIDRWSSNSAAITASLPYVGLPFPWPLPAPAHRNLSASTEPEGLESGDAFLQQVLSQFSRELRSPMPEEVVAQIEEETPEIPAAYDLATYEYEYEES
jgi:hypothetical protein